MEVQPKQCHQVTDEAHFKPLLQLKAGPVLLRSASPSCINCRKVKCEVMVAEVATVQNRLPCKRQSRQR